VDADFGDGSMIQAVNGAQAIAGRISVTSKLSPGANYWRANYMGGRPSGVVVDDPQAFLLEMNAHQKLVSHFHTVDQFQIFVGGSGTIGRNKPPTLGNTMHYADHHTGYGPILAGAQGFSYFTLRPQTDAGAVEIDKPGYREHLKPSKKRHCLVNLVLSTEPVLHSRTEVTLEPLMPGQDRYDDGLGAFMLRIGPGMRAVAPDPRGTGGQYLLVLNGDVQFNGATYPLWSLLFAGPDDPACAFTAGTKGVEIFIGQYPARH
jgi:hypothetical protein